ncbi:MAG: metallophosphoesterase [Chthoniobacterales bacterium]
MKTKYTTIAWMTDLHLHQANPANRTKFLKELVAAEFDAAIITGDISTSSQVIEDLASLSDACGNRNLFFVLGNHDFFDASFSSVDVAVEKLCKTRDNLHYLEHGGTHRLAENLGLVGCRGWSDGRAGLGSDSRIYSSDAFRIRDLMVT